MVLYFEGRVSQQQRSCTSCCSTGGVILHTLPASLIPQGGIQTVAAACLCKKHNKTFNNKYINSTKRISEETIDLHVC